MYILEDLIARLKTPNSRFAKVTDKNSVTVDSLLEHYKDIHLILSHYGHEDKVLVLKVSDIYSLLMTTNRSQTVQQWLTSMASETLPVHENGWELIEGSVIQTDLLDVGFRANLVDINNKEDADKHREDLVNVRLNDGSSRYSEYGENCIFTCNGLLHIHDCNNEGIFLQGAGLSTYIENKIQFSALSFKALGGVRVIPITPSMISRHNGGRYHDGFYINVGDKDLTNKTVMLSICGVLHYNDQNYSVISDSDIKVHWSNVGLVERFVEFRDKIHWGLIEDRVGLSSEETTYVDLTAAQEDDVILHALQMDQTFVIVVDTDQVSYDKVVLERTRLPGRFLSNTQPTGPVVLGNGLINPYRVREEGSGVYSVVMADNWLKNRYENTRGRHGSNNIMANNKSQWPQYLADGFMLDLSTEVIKL